MEDPVPVPTEVPKSTGVSPAAEKTGLKKWLGKHIEVELVDGRLIRGLFVCTDNHPNIIMRACEERWTRDGEVRDIGLVMIAREHIKRILFELDQE